MTTRPAGKEEKKKKGESVDADATGRTEVAPISFPLSTPKADSDHDTQITPSPVKRGQSIYESEIIFNIRILLNSLSMLSCDSQISMTDDLLVTN